MAIHHGSCHCGRVKFELHADIRRVMECNCSICRRQGALWQPASDDTLKIVEGEGELTLYQFGTMRAKHYFCKHCGVQPFVRPRLDPTRWAVNVRCFDDVDLGALEVGLFDGENWEAAASAFVAAMQKKPAAG
jgi:hypothetical protein